MARYHKNVWLLLILGLAGCHIGSCCNARPTARAAKCEANLQKLYAALQKYVVKHGDLPRDGAGKVSIDLLNSPNIQKEINLAPSVLRCPEDTNLTGSSYILNPELSVSELGPGSATIVACERYTQHPDMSNKAGYYKSHLLLGDGAVKVMIIPPKQRELWLRRFLAGDKRTSKYVENRQGAPVQQNLTPNPPDQQTPNDAP